MNGRRVTRSHVYNPASEDSMQTLLSLYNTGVQAQLDVTGTVCLLLGDSKWTFSGNGTTRGSLRWERPRPTRALHAAHLTVCCRRVHCSSAQVSREGERCVHIPTPARQLWCGARWGRRVVPNRLIFKVWKWVTVTKINWAEWSHEREKIMSHFSTTTCRPLRTSFTSQARWRSHKHSDGSAAPTVGHRFS